MKKIKVIPKEIINKWYAEEYSKIQNSSVYGKPEKHILHFINLVQKYKLKKVLELGSGDGRNLIELAKRGLNVTGIDLFGGEAFKSTAKNLGLEVNFIKEDITKYNFANEKYDVIICSEVLHLIERKYLDNILNKIKTATRDNGLIYINILTNIKRFFLRTKEEFKYKNQPDYSSEEIKEILFSKFNDWKIIEEGIYHEEQNWPIKSGIYPIDPYHWGGDYVFIMAKKEKINF